MNTQKSVFNKISKIEKQVESQEVELSEVQKVELGLTADLVRAQSGAEKLYNDAKQAADKAEDNFQKAKRICDKNLDRLEQLQKQTFDAVMDARQAAKDLGLLPFAFPIAVVGAAIIEFTGYGERFSKFHHNIDNHIYEGAKSLINYFL